MFDLLDLICAEQLKVDVSVFVKKIESTTEYRRTIIIDALMGEDEEKIEKARKCFNLIQ